MSNRPCNYCNLQRIRHQAEVAGKTVTLDSSPLTPFFPDGVNVYVNGEFVSWFGAVGDHCAC